MLYNLLVPLSEQFQVLNLFRYLTFRTGGAVITALVLAFLLGPALIAWLRTLADSPPALPSEAYIAAEQAELAPAPETPAGDEPAETQSGDTAAQATEDENSADAPADQPAAQ